MSARSCRAPTNSSGSFRSWTRSSASGNARRTSGSASSAPSRRMWRYSPGEQKLRPRRAALLVVRPLHLVEDEHLAVSRRHLDGAAQHRRVLVDPLLARDQPDLLLAEQRPRAGGAPPARASAAGRRRRRAPARRGTRARRASCRSSSARGARRRSRAVAAARGAGSRSVPRRASRPRACRHRWPVRAVRPGTVAEADANGDYGASRNGSRATTGGSCGDDVWRGAPALQGMCPAVRRGSSSRNERQTLR